MFGGVTETVGFPRGYGSNGKSFDLSGPTTPNWIVARTCDCLIRTSSTFQWGPAPLGSAVTAARLSTSRNNGRSALCELSIFVLPCLSARHLHRLQRLCTRALPSGRFLLPCQAVGRQPPTRRLELRDQRVHDFPREHPTSTGPRSPRIPQRLRRKNPPVGEHESRQRR